jgi:hypothetical protein
MNDLEQGFAELRDRMAWPEMDDVAARAEAVITAPAAPPWYKRVRSLFCGGFVAMALTVAVVTPARSAILELLGVRGLNIERVERLPVTPRQDRGVLGHRATLEQARASALFPILTPRVDAPSEVRITDVIPGGGYSLIYPPGPGLPAARPGIGLLLTQFQGESTPYVDKLITYGARVTRVSVDGNRGFWIRGGRRVVVYRDRSGLISQAGLELPDTPLLIWERDGVALRLQAKVSLAHALRIARSVR